MMTFRGRLQLVGAAMALASLLLPSSIALGADPVGSAPGAAPPPTSVVLQARSTGDGSWRLEAQVFDAAGEAVAGGQVQFVATVDFLGRREVPIGAAQTNVSGRAVLDFSPTAGGVQHLVARAAGDDGRIAEGSLELDVGEASTAVRPAAPALPIVGQWAAPVAVLVVVTVWAVLAIVLVAGVAGIWRGRPKERSSPLSQFGSPAVPGLVSGREQEG